jgi:nucleoid-associated protein YgaU
MKDTPTRVFGLMCVLVGVWTTVYWLYEPGEPPVTFDQSPVKVADPLDNDSASPSGGPMAELSPPIPPPERRPAPPSPRPAANPPKPAPTSPLDQPKTRVVPPEYWEYTVQPNDSMESIAKKLFGEGRLWVKIAEANPLLDARKLIPGRTKLRIPKDLANIQGKEVVVPQDAPRATPTRPNPEPVAPAKPPEPAKPAQQDYIVKAGDTLSDIAKTFYGKSSLWRKIYDANKDVIDDPDAVKPGTTIRIPPQD